MSKWTAITESAASKINGDRFSNSLLASCLRLSSCCTLCIGLRIPSILNSCLLFVTRSPLGRKFEITSIKARRSLVSFMLDIRWSIGSLRACIFSGFTRLHSCGSAIRTRGLPRSLGLLFAVLASRPRRFTVAALLLIQPSRLTCLFLLGLACGFD